MSDLRFCIDRCDPSAIEGWIDVGNAVAAIEIVINGRWACTLAPVAYRPDLEAAGLGDGRRAFSFPLAGRLGPGQNLIAMGCDGKTLYEGRVMVVEEAQADSADTHALSQTRWRGEEAPAGLTWGRLMTGDSLWDLFERHRRFRSGDHVLEIGPGYGRLLRTAIERKIPFASYTGVELSRARVSRLSEEFDLPNARFVEGDIDSWSGQRKYDVVLCSSTFEHLHPDCGAALRNIHRQLAAGGQVFIDFIAGEEPQRGFEPNGTYIRIYDRNEIAALFAKCGYAVKAIERCTLGTGAVGPVERLVVVALPAAVAAAVNHPAGSRLTAR